MKSSSSEESVRKRSHSVGGNSLAPSTLSTMTTTNICEITDAVMDIKQEIIGKALSGFGFYVTLKGLKSQERYIMSERTQFMQIMTKNFVHFYR